MRNLLIVLFLGVLFVSLRAQEGYEHFSVPAHGAGRTYVVTSRGLDAIGLNPALLILPPGKQFEFRVFPVTGFGIDAGESFSDADALTNVFNTKSFDSLDTKRIIELLRDEKLSGRGDASILSAAYDAGTLGTFAFSWTTHAGMRTDIPEDFLIFFSNVEANIIQDTGSVYNFDLQALWHNEFSLSYARTLFTSPDPKAFLTRFRAGASIKYASGIGILKVEDGNYFKWGHVPPGGNTFINANYRVYSSHTSDFDPKNAPNRFTLDFITASQAGSGVGADLGISLDLFGLPEGGSALHVGTSITGIGSITWTNSARERTANDLRDTFYHDVQFNTVIDSLKAFEGTLLKVPEFNQPLPTMFRFGAQLDLDALGTKIWGYSPQIAMEIAQGLTDIVGSLSKPRFGVGMSLVKTGEKIDSRFSGGFALDHRSADITLGGGLTLFDYIAFDIATAHLLELFSSTPRIDVAASLKILL